MPGTRDKEKRKLKPILATLQFSFEPADTNRFKDSAENSPVKGSGNPAGSSTPEGEEELSYKTSYPKLLSVMMNE